MKLLTEEAYQIFNSYSLAPQGSAYSSECIFQQEVPDLDASIILPCYNVEPFLRKCLDSLVQQRTSFSYEIIAINDGSKDGTGAILTEYAKKYKNLKVITQVNKGLSAARNIGMENSRGRYLLFVDSDDYVSENYLQELLRVAITRDIDIVACSYYSFIGLIKSTYRNPRNSQDRAFLSGVPWGKAYKREFFNHIKFPEQYWFEDTVIAHLIYPQLKTFVTIDTCYYAYRRNIFGITLSSQAKPKSIDTIFVTEHILGLVEKLYGNTLMESSEYFELLLEQFHLNQQRIMELPEQYRKLLFELQASYMQKYYSDFSTIQAKNAKYLQALRQNDYNLSRMIVKKSMTNRLIDILRKYL